MKQIFYLLLLGLLYRILMGLSGIDGVDAGFCNTFYQIFFQHPDSNEFNFIYYLLGLLGALWEKYFGIYGLLGFRVFEALTLTCAISILCLTFKNSMPRRYLMLSVILSFTFPTIFVTFHYNTLSFLFIATAAYCFKQSLVSTRSYWLLFSGMAIGFSLFVRLVNGTLLILLAIPLIYHWYNSPHVAIKKTTIMLIGILCGIVIILSIMLTLGQTTYYFDGLSEAFSTFQGNDATHSHNNLITKYFKSYVNVILQIIAIVILYYAYKRSNKLTKKLRHVTYILITAALTSLTYTSLPYLTAMALCIIILIPLLLHTSKRDNMKAVAVFLLIATIVYPFGSDIGAQGVFHWCAGLLIFPAIWATSQIITKENRFPLIVAYISVLLCTICRTTFYVYGENSNRFACTEQIQSERLNIFTTHEKAKQYEKTIKAINQHLGEKRLLFVTNQASELYYATHSLPYEGHVQPVIYLGEKLVSRLDERLQHFNNYPLIAMLNQDTPSAETPEVQKITTSWMLKHNYQLVYDDGYLKLYKNYH